MKLTPARGMKDILPREMEIREYVINKIKDVYRSFGFVSIDTPSVESIENLCSKQGGENEKLIFKILKRGEKLDFSAAKDEDDLVDSGLRYDLTVPLSRYYAANAAVLPSPFKAMQIGNVWRADRPQKGRFRQFTQCDIDILGDGSMLAEVELIIATTTLLGQLGFSGFTVRINDRRILKAMAKVSGFAQEAYDDVFIILDKMDKIGVHGVEEELNAAGYAAESVQKYVQFFRDGALSTGVRSFLGNSLDGNIEDGAVEGLDDIISLVNAAKSTAFSLVFDPTLVRGMSYYTGTIFEIGIEGFSGSVGGGGRYDNMIGTFTKTDVCACGFSIGFERIIGLLMDGGFTVPTGRGKAAFLLDKRLPVSRYADILAEATAKRAEGCNVLVTLRKKNTRAQKDALTAEGYTEIKEFFE